ncbi:helix-turn-helix transcriptional regulator [Micromonospora polyrhachis]|uniref:Transcriptional regulator with XRE-family HTH domain n=1 Tax=Micromonospora polyrhachis TaxID=1282883 RepID=A0A7W7SPJ2_9ACTN|nr:helix-turn-helix transcriptional regulator [Micromonospora polyrhachis]MBB4958582.1 transcriptional regulator with XRE-family HTH domain [Micromonospora polyrhachis]
MTEDIGSTVPRRQLGRTLRQLREEACITLDGAASTLRCTRQKIWRIESGLGPTRVPDVKALCDLYDVAPELVEALSGLATQTKSSGWWHAYGNAVPEWFELYVGLESAASHLRGYDDALIPGIFQTKDYMLGVHGDRSDLTDEEMHRRIGVRRQRQRLLTRRIPRPPRLESVLSESVLLKCVGGPAVMAGQLRHLLKLTQLPQLSIRVLPLAAGAHLGAEAGTFMMLSFPPGNRSTPEPPVVYCESWTGALYLDRPSELAAYEKVWASLDALTLDEQQSKSMISKIIAEAHHG